MKEGVVVVPGSKVTPILTFALASDALTGMPDVCISSKTNLNTGTSGRVDTVEVVGIVDSVKIIKERGTKSMGSEI